jgi:hypothetical protein
MAGRQTSQALSGFAAPTGRRDPSMEHALRQAPDPQTFPPPQSVPLAARVQPPLEISGWHCWQRFAGFDADAA